MFNRITSAGTVAQKRSKSSLFARLPLLLAMLMLCAVMSSCADVQHNLKPCLEGHVYGFWGGLWHGTIAPFAWVGSWFSNDIAVWAVNNNGGWYAFGFILGVGALTGGSSKAASK